MSSADKIITAVKIIQDNLSNLISKIDAEIDRGKAKILFLNGQTLYIKYNDFSEYGYQFLFSDQPLNRVRYDNFDKNWKVESAPHHLHPRGKEDGIASPMNGNPEKDIPILCEMIRQNLH